MSQKSSRGGYFMELTGMDHVDPTVPTIGKRRIKDRRIIVSWESTKRGRGSIRRGVQSICMTQNPRAILTTNAFNRLSLDVSAR